MTSWSGKRAAPTAPDFAASGIDSVSSAAAADAIDVAAFHSWRALNSPGDSYPFLLSRASSETSSEYRDRATDAPDGAEPGATVRAHRRRADILCGGRRRLGGTNRGRASNYVGPRRTADRPAFSTVTPPRPRDRLGRALASAFLTLVSGPVPIYATGGARGTATQDAEGQTHSPCARDDLEINPAAPPASMADRAAGGEREFCTSPQILQKS